MQHSFLKRESKSVKPIIVCPKQFKAVVVILSWFDANPQHLREFEEFYHEKGCATVSMIPPSQASKTRLADLAVNATEEAVRIVRMYESRYAVTLPMFTHIFSSGGTMLLEQLELRTLQALSPDEEDPLDKFGNHSMCFESNSVAPNMDDMMSRASSCNISTNTTQTKDNRPRWRKWLNKQRIINTITAQDLVFFSQRLAMGGQIFDSSPCFRERGPQRRLSFVKDKWDLLAKSRLATRQLFIYSDSDKIANAGDIEEFMTKRNNFGVHVGALKFNDTQHLDHYARHAHCYETLLLSFLDSANYIVDEDRLVTIDFDSETQEESQVSDEYSITDNIKPLRRLNC